MTADKIIIAGYTRIREYGSTYTAIKQNTKSCTYVGLYGSGLFSFGSYVSFPTLFACFWGFDIHTSSFTFIENVFYYSCVIMIIIRRL